MFLFALQAVECLAFDTPEPAGQFGCLVDSTGQVDSVAVRLVKSMQGSQFLIRTTDGKTILATVHVTPKGIRAVWHESAGLTQQTRHSEAIPWEDIVLLECKNTKSRYGIAHACIIAGVAFAILTAGLIIPTLN